MTRRPLHALVLLTALLLAPVFAAAQAPFSVTITPTLNPLPIGLCGAVQLRLADATGNAPRNLAGLLMGLADFDMSVSSPDPRAVVGQQIDASHWAVCGCQAGVAGATATITASYPAARLSGKARAHVDPFQTTTTFTLAAAKGSVDPPGCGSPVPPTIAAAAPATPLQAAPSGRTVPTPPAPPPPPRAPAGASSAGQPLAPAPPGTPAPKAPAAGAPPTGVAVSGTPLRANVTWNAAPGATRYAVWRKDDAQLSVEKSPAAFTATAFTETLPDPRITYRYTVVAHYADGTSGEAPAVQYISPPLVNPTGFTLTQKGQTSSTHAGMEFSWNAVPGAVRYRLDGPGLPGTGYFSTTTTTVFPKVPRGAGTWKVTALYPGNFADYPNGTTVSQVIRFLPTPSQPWLTKSNGPGALEQVQTPSFTGCNAGIGNDDPLKCAGSYGSPGQLAPYDPVEAKWLGTKSEYAEVSPGLLRWLDVAPQLWDYHNQWPNEAVYGNPGDLGVGRRTDCVQRVRSAPTPGMYTVCYAAAHGIAPGNPGFNDPQVITRPGEGQDAGFLLAMVITKDPSGSVFLVFSPAGKYKLSPTVTLDIQGPKYVPHACLSCHGGTYNATTRKVDGASLLPIDPDLQSFATAADKAAQQEKIRRINEMIARSGSSPAIVAYINGLYGNAVHVQNRQATPDYVPPGWQSQAGLYRQVVRPYCAMCHLAATSDLSFASWGNFQLNKLRIKAAVCSAHTMPHSELQFTEFWLKDTGPVYLPGLMAASLGFPSC